MGDRETIDYDPAEALLLEGRRALSSGDLVKARWFFEQVLSRRPDDARASLGLNYVTRQSEHPPASDVDGAALQVVDLVRAKKYDEALDLLRREALVKPGDPAIQKSIAHLEKHVMRRGMVVLGGEDAQWEAAAGASGPLVDLLDGERTVHEVLEMADVPRTEAVRRLVALSDAGLAHQVDGQPSGVVSIAPLVALKGEEPATRRGSAPELKGNAESEPELASEPKPDERTSLGEGRPLRDPEDVPRLVHADLGPKQEALAEGEANALGTEPERGAARWALGLLFLLVLSAVAIATRL